MIKLKFVESVEHIESCEQAFAGIKCTFEVQLLSATLLYHFKPFSAKSIEIMS